MSDTAFPTYMHYGTNAQRLAFTPAPPATGQPIYLWRETDTSNTYLYDTAWRLLTSGTAGGKLIQTVNTETGAVATGTTQIPVDDTKPQNTEGDEYMTLAVTPTSSTNKLVISVVIFVSSSQQRTMTAALFQDSTADALAVGTNRVETPTGMAGISFTHYMAAGTTSATTFKVRAGANNTGTTTFNGSAGGRIYGGVFASSITIQEIVP